MNAEEVCAMIDAITEGREYVYTPDLKRPAKQIIVDDEGISFFEDFEESFDVNDPRTAREIAGALVAWANRKEGANLLESEPREDGMFHTKMQMIRPTHAEEATRSGNRAEWYRRNVKRMTQETKNRNLKDLRGILPHSSGKADDDDIRAAIQILIEAGAE